MTQGKSQVNLLTIKQFADLCRTTPRTLRYWEKQGLFIPAMIDVYNKYRLYSPRQARDFIKIRLLQNFHVSLKEIKGSIQDQTINIFLQNKLFGLQEEIAEKEKEYVFLKKIDSFLFNQHRFKNHFKKESFGPFLLFCIKIENAQYHKINEYLTNLITSAKRLGLKCEEGGLTFYLTNIYQPKSAPLEIALICKSKKLSNKVKNLPENYYFKNYPKTLVLTYIHKGPYEYLTLIYQKLYDYIDDQKQELDGLVFEKYIYDPANTKSKYDYVTKIFFPIKSV